MQLVPRRHPLGRRSEDGPPGPRPRPDVRTMNTNIEHYLRDKSRTMRIDIETAGEAFPEFWERIGAEGDLEAALRELQVHHHAGTEQRSTPRETPPPDEADAARAGARCCRDAQGATDSADPAARSAREPHRATAARRRQPDRRPLRPRRRPHGPYARLRGRPRAVRSRFDLLGGHGRRLGLRRRHPRPARPGGPSRGRGRGRRPLALPGRSAGPPVADLGLRHRHVIRRHARGRGGGGHRAARPPAHQGTVTSGHRVRRRRRGSCRPGSTTR